MNKLIRKMQLVFALTLVLLNATALAKEARYPEFGNGRIEQKLVEAKGTVRIFLQKNSIPL